MNFDVSRTAPHDVYNLLIGLVAPRPIALVTSRGSDGVLNAAPYSAYNYLSVDPPIVGIGVAPRPGKPGGGFAPKDTARNVRETGEFVVNVVSEELAGQMNVCATDFPPDVSEVDVAGLTTTPSSVVGVPRLAEARAALECREFTTLAVGRSSIILGRVVAVYVEDALLDPAGPYVRAEDLHAVGRMNGQGAYVRTRDAFFHLPRITYAAWQDGQRGADGHHTTGNG